MPSSASGQWSASETPEATTPHANAHIGGNHVMGLSSSATAEGWGKAMTGQILHLTSQNVNWN
jgi:hypothetical protein